MMPMTADTSAGSPLIEATAHVSLPGRAHFRIRGEERAAFLHSLVTNEIKKLAAGTGCHAAWLTPKGKMLVDLHVLALADLLDLDAEPALAPRLQELLEKYGPFSPVQIENLTGRETVVHVAGPGSIGTLQRAGAPSLPGDLLSHFPASIGSVPVLTVRVDRGATWGFDLRFDASRLPEVTAALAAAGSIPVQESDLEAARIEAGIPRWGFELDETVLPDEAGLNRTAVSYNKGCYIGQETVARLRTYGHVNRHIASFRLPPGSQVVVGAEIFHGDSVTGKVTSVATALDQTAVVAMGFVKRDCYVEGTEVGIHSSSGRIPCGVLTLPRPGSAS
jgi:aminomethyltransferase